VAGVHNARNTRVTFHLRNSSGVHLIKFPKYIWGLLLLGLRLLRLLLRLLLLVVWLLLLVLLLPLLVLLLLLGLLLRLLFLHHDHFLRLNETCFAVVVHNCISL
jgi:hypothetical protein